MILGRRNVKYQTFNINFVNWIYAESSWSYWNIKNIEILEILDQGGTFAIVAKAEALLVISEQLQYILWYYNDIIILDGADLCVAVDDGEPQGAPFCSGGSGSQMALVGYFTSLHNEHQGAGIR